MLKNLNIRKIRQYCPLCYNNYKKRRINILTQDKYNKKLKAFECKNCSLIFLSDYKKCRRDIYNKNYLILGQSQLDEDIINSKINHFEYLLKPFKVNKNNNNNKLLDIGAGRGGLLYVAKKKGFDIFGVELSKHSMKYVNKLFKKKIFNGLFEDTNYPDNFFDIITMTDVLEHLSEPNKFFEEVSRILKPSGLVLITTPNTDSITRKILSKNWFQYKDEHVLYYNKKSITYLLEKYNFKIQKYKNNLRFLSLSYYYNYCKKYKFSLISKIFILIFPLFPRYVKGKVLKNPFAGEMYVIAQKNKLELENN